MWNCQVVNLPVGYFPPACLVDVPREIYGRLHGKGARGGLSSGSWLTRDRQDRIIQFIDNGLFGE